MAQIKNIKRQSAISNFQQGAPQGGSAFKLLAQGLNEIYDRVAPVALNEMTQIGESLGRESARAQFGSERPYQKQQSVSGGAGVDTLSGGGGGGRAVAYRDGIASIESKGSGNYRAVGPTNKKLGRALGRYQIMEANIGPWSKAALGRSVSAEEFLASDGIQDAIFDHRFGGYVGKYGEEGAAQAWFAGEGGVGKLGRKDVLGTSVGVYGDKFKAALAGQGSVTSGGGVDALLGGTSGTPEPAYEAPTMLRTSSGALESRLFSPSSGPLLQAHNAVAKVAYQSEVLNKSSVDLMDMSAQFELDPEGYAGAAEQYVDALVDSVPTDYQGELRGSLEKQVRQRANGMMEEKQRDTRQRANNSSSALVSRWSDALSDAIVTGDQAQIGAAQSELDALLQVREALPGLAWTTEQSANVVIKARKSAEVRAAKLRVEQGKKTKATLDLIIEGAQRGANVAGEEILNDPAVLADHPELAREAKAHVSLRDYMPEFMELPPQQQSEAVAQLASEEVVEEFELDIVKAAGDAAKANKKAWDDDAVKQAFTVLKSDPPPPLPEITLDDPRKITAGFAARRDYMNRKRQEGYTSSPAMLSDEEAEGLQAVMMGDSPPEVRAAIAGAMVAGFKEDAITVFDEIDGDKVTMFAGKMMAVGGNPAMATTILNGQQIINEGLVRVPPKADRIEQFNKEAAAAFAGTSGSEAAQGEIMAAAQAIYAADPSARGIEPTSEAATELMKGSIQKAMGQTKTRRGTVLGGVQLIMGASTILPPGISGDAVNDALQLAFSGEVEGESSFSRGMNALTGGLFGADVTTQNVDMWGDGATASGIGPMFNGKPIPHAYTRDGGIRVVPHGGNQYRIEILTSSGPKKAEDANGNVFFFDMQKLMDNAP
tara:strand:+ start:32540 stop:35191 length:2652 start_codon:yes stop_codon:yes gene_type:complete